MNVSKLISERRMKGVTDSLDGIALELKNLTVPLKRTLDPKERKKQEIINALKHLREETDRLASEMDKNKDTESLKAITKKVKEIVEEKERLMSQVKNL